MLQGKLYALVGALVVAALMMGGAAALAQEGPQTFVSGDGTLTFEYPEGWLAEDYFGTILVANSEETIDAMLGDAEQIASGQALVLVVTPDSLAEEGAMFGLFPEMSVEEMASAYAVNIIGVETIDTLETGTLGDHSVARLEANIPEAEITLYSIDLGDGKIGLAVLLSAQGEREDYSGALENIVATMAYQPLPEASETGAVVWQQLYPVDYEAEDGYYGAEGIVVGPDDTIYVLDSNVGIRVFSAEGEPQGIIRLEDPFWGLAAFDMAPDGTFWGMDNWGTFGHFDANGTVLSSFDIATTEVGELSFLGLRLLVGPDGNLYIVNPQDVDDETSLGVLYVVSPEGEVLRSFELGIEDYGFEAHMAFGPEGNLYVLSAYDNTGITVYDTEGNVLREGVGLNALRRSYLIGGLAIGADGSIYVAGANAPIYRLANDGTLLGMFGEDYYRTSESDGDAAFSAGSFANISAVGVLSNGDVVVGDTTLNWWQLVRVSFSE